MNEFEFQIASKIQFRPAYFIQSDVFRKNINRKRINIKVCCDFCFTIFAFEACVNNVEIPYM